MCPVNRNPRQPGRRPYHSPERARRAQQTRLRIVNAAQELFLQRGYVSTTMRAIADAAGVAEKTVYLAFANKPAVLDAVIDNAISSAEPNAIPTAPDQAATSDAAVAILRSFSQTASAIMERTARVLAIAESAATADPELGKLRERGHTAMRERFEAVAAALNTRGALAPNVSQSHAAATIYAIVNEAVYLRLTDGYGWSSQDYAQWLELVLTAALTRQPSGRDDDC
jgi:AcrR family transcriptional regulator